MSLPQRKSETNPLQILVVDDEASIRTTLTGVLEDEGFQTLRAENGIEALELLKTNQPDLVFLDIWMPGLDGVETLRKMKELRPELPVVMISGHATIANALEATRNGAFDFIEKPLNLESILLAVARATENRRTQTDAESSRSSDVKSPVLFAHPGINSEGMKGRNFGQRTLRRGVLLYGHCLHSGQKSGLVLEPLPPNSGIHFAPIGDVRAVPAHVDYVQSTGFATTIRSGASSAATIEHLMASLHAYQISNLLVKCNAEVPIFDGSALEFCRAIEEAGIEEQGGDWYEIAVTSPIEVRSNEDKRSNRGEWIRLEPASEFSVRYDLQYPAPVGAQTFEFTLTDLESFKNEIAPARTFGFMRDIEKLQRAGLAAGGRLDNFILIGDDRVVNTELRFPEELSRHKILDVLGDLYLIGRPLRARIHASMTGHSDNVALLKKLWDAMQA